MDRVNPRLIQKPVGKKQVGKEAEEMVINKFKKSGKYKADVKQASKELIKQAKIEMHVANLGFMATQEGFILSCNNTPARAPT